MDTLGLYISIPFCRSKCSFCNFASGVFPASYFERYTERLEEDIRQTRARMKAIGADVPLKVDTVYLGGGTPSILPPALLKRIFHALREEFEITGQAEITAECAPGQLSDDVIAAMVEEGVNRVSFGVQSFVDTEAAATGRLHDREISLRDIERVRKAGISAISVDLIAGLPLQTAASWEQSLECLAATRINHASVYMFEVDEESRLGSEVLSSGNRYHAGAVPTDDAMADLYLEAVEFLGRHGLRQYEISNFARRGGESRHNKKYWRREPYLGFGLDAHSMLRGGCGEVRFAESDELESYLRGDQPPAIYPVSKQEAVEETWFLGLRLNEGVHAPSVHARYGSAARFDNVVADLITEGLVEQVGEQICLTQRGRLLSNDVFARFLTTDPSVRFSEKDELIQVV